MPCAHNTLAVGCGFAWVLCVAALVFVLFMWVAVLLGPQWRGPRPGAGAWEFMGGGGYVLRTGPQRAPRGQGPKPMGLSHAGRGQGKGISSGDGGWGACHFRHMQCSAGKPVALRSHGRRRHPFFFPLKRSFIPRPVSVFFSYHAYLLFRAPKVPVFRIRMGTHLSASLLLITKDNPVP